MATITIYPARGTYIVPSIGSPQIRTQTKNFAKSGNTISYSSTTFGGITRYIMAVQEGYEVELHQQSLNLETDVIYLHNEVTSTWDDLQPFIKSNGNIVDGANDIKFELENGNIKFRDTLTDNTEAVKNALAHTIVTGVTFDYPENPVAGSKIVCHFTTENVTYTVGNKYSGSEFLTRSDGNINANHFARCTFEPSYVGDVVRGFKIQWLYTMTGHWFVTYQSPIKYGTRASQSPPYCGATFLPGYGSFLY